MQTPCGMSHVLHDQDKTNRNMIRINAKQVPLPQIVCTVRYGQLY